MTHSSLLLLLLTTALAPALARPASDLSLLSALRSPSWGLKVPDQDKMKETLRSVRGKKAARFLTAVCFSRFNNPYINFLMKDQLFLQHLQRFLRRQDSNSFNQLRNRVKTISRRRSDVVSTRFFLRD